MPLIKAQCTNCQGILEVDKDKEAAICPFCGTPYIVEKAVNLFVSNFTASPTEYVSNGVTLLKLQEYERANECFMEMTKKMPGDWRSWLGLSLAQISNSKYRLLYADNISKLAPDDIKAKLDTYYIRSADSQNYVKTKLDRLNAELNKNELVMDLPNFENKVANLKDEEHELNEEYSELQKCRSSHRTFLVILIVCHVICIFLTCSGISRTLFFLGLICWACSLLIYGFGELHYSLKYKGYGRKEEYYTEKFANISRQKAANEAMRQDYLIEKNRLNNEITSCINLKNIIEQSPTYENYISILEGK